MAQKIHLDFTAPSQQAKVPSFSNSSADMHEDHNREITLSASYMPFSAMLPSLSASLSASPSWGWTGGESSGDMPTHGPAEVTRDHTELHRSTAQLAFRLVLLLFRIFFLTHFRAIPISPLSYMQVNKDHRGVVSSLAARGIVLNIIKQALSLKSQGQVEQYPANINGKSKLLIH